MTRVHVTETSLQLDNKILCYNTSHYSFKTSRKTCKPFVFKMSSDGTTNIIDEMETVFETVEESFSDLFEQALAPFQY